MNTTKIGISGCLGKMGSELVRATIADKDLIFVGGYEQSNHPSIGKSIGEVLNIENENILSNNGEEIFRSAEVVVDFTTPESTLETLMLADKFSTPLVIGTTGLDKYLKDKVNSLSKKIPIVQSYNMSIGVNLMLELIKKSSEILNKKNFNTEIYETHHQHKKDSPSGTAIELGRAIAEGRRISFEEYKIYRDGSNNKEVEGQIGITSFRKGEVPGEHTVDFIGKNESLQFSHKAVNRSIFVEGAIKAIKWVVKQNSGVYNMRDVLGL